MKINATTTAIEHDDGIILLHKIVLIRIKHNNLWFIEKGVKGKICLVFDSENETREAYNNLMDRLGFKMD